MSNTTQLVSAIKPGYVDPRKAVNLSNGNEFETRIVNGEIAFAANAAGSTTTIVGADADITAGSNIVRPGDKFVLVDANGDLKENTVFTVDSLASATGTTTVTFSPAASVATVGTDEAHFVGTASQDSVADLDDRLLDLGFSQDYIDSLTLNDKQYQIRVSDDPGSL